MGIFDVPEEKKQEYWNHFMTLKKSFWARGFTEVRLKKVKPLIWADEFFWSDVVQRHGGLDKTPGEMLVKDKSTYDHCMGNMMGMIFHTMVDRGIIRP